MLKHTKLLQGIMASAWLVVSLLAFAPVRTFADCPQGQIPTTAGTCCPAGNQVISSAGDVSCPAPSGPANCGTNVAAKDALGCLMKTYINPLIDLLSSAVGVVVAITIIRGAMTYTSSGGDPSKAAAGKTHIINALIGLAAYLMLYAFLQFLIPGGLLNG